MVLRFPFGFVWAFLSPGEGLSSTQEDWALGRFICQWTIHCCYCWSFCVLATTISFWHLSSLPQNSSGRSFHHGGLILPPPLPPHQTPRLPAYLSSDGERKPSVVLLLPDEGKGHIKTVALPHRRCHLTAS